LRCISTGDEGKGRVILTIVHELRTLMDSNRELARKIDDLEAKYDEQFAIVFEAIKRLLDEETSAAPNSKSGKKMGFHP